MSGMRHWVILGVGAALLCLLPARAGEVRFRMVKGDETGLRAAMQKWHDVELKRQGGKFKSHGWWPWGLRAFDFDNDGDLDLLPSHHGMAGSIVLKSAFKETGQLKFTDVTSGLGVSSRALPGADDRPWIFDFDGDGFLDIAGLSDEAKPSSFFNQGGKKWVPIAGFSFRPLSHPKEVRDLNGDGYPDLDGGPYGRWTYEPKRRRFQRSKAAPRADSVKIPQAVVQVFKELKKKKNNRFFHVTYLTHLSGDRDVLGPSPDEIDLNGDGRGDVVASASGGYGGDYAGRYLIRGEDGALEDKTKALGLPEAGAPVMIEDLTGDGRPEILIAGKGTGGVYVNDGKGRFTRKESALSTFLTKRGPYLLRAYRVDLDNDGDKDLVVSNPRYGREEIHENKGNGNFTRILAAGGWDSNPVVVCDINNDGRMDAVIGGPGKTTITIYLNQTPDAGHFCGILPRMKSPNPYAVGAVVEVFQAGTLKDKKALPIWKEKAHPDATPVHAGLGREEKFDLRVAFPNGKTVTREGLSADKRLAVTPEGRISEVNGK